MDRVQLLAIIIKAFISFSPTVKAKNLLCCILFLILIHGCQASPTKQGHGDSKTSVLTNSSSPLLLYDKYLIHGSTMNDKTELCSPS